VGVLKMICYVETEKKNRQLDKKAELAEIRT
jgi:hypothetical protein